MIKKEELASTQVYENAGFGAVLRQGAERPVTYSADTLQDLAGDKWVLPFGDGQWVFTEKMTLLIRCLEDMIRRDVAKSLGFKEWLFPRLLKQEILEKFATSIYTPDLLFKVEGYVNNGQNNGNKPVYMLDPVQCAPLYATLSKTGFDVALPFKIFECKGGWTYRNETKLDGLVRCIDFLRTEMVYISYPEDIVKIRSQVMEAMAGLLDSIGINWRITVGEPCFKLVRSIELYQSAKKMEDYPVLDFEGYIPHKDQWIEFSGCSNERARLIKAFGITQEKIWSGCVGIGLNRLAYVFLSTHGLDTTKWPEAVQNRMLDLS